MSPDCQRCSAPQVTCVTVSPYAGRTLEAAPRLLAGSLDGHVKIYELDTFKVLVAELVLSHDTTTSMAAKGGP